MRDRDRWNARYRPETGVPAPNARLVRYAHLLRRGLALDLASGPGRNASALRDWSLVQVDLSDAALSRSQGPRVVADAFALPFRPGIFDTVVCTYFFEPRLDLVELLKPGGTLFFETYTLADARYRPDFPSIYRFDPEQLSVLFGGLEPLLWEETDDGARVFGTFVGRKA